MRDGQLPWSWQQQKVVTNPGPQETNEGTVSGRAAALEEKDLVGQGMQLLTKIQQGERWRNKYF